jgi:signal transduction histidine kinase
LKFTNPGGSVVVELHELRNRLIVSVKDNGRGINPSHIEAILSEKESISNLGTEGEKGTGMGLSLASQLAKQMGWKLSIDSNLKDGTKAYLTIPI